MCPECGSDSVMAKRRRKKARQPEGTRQLKFSIIMLAIVCLAVLGWAITATFSSSKKSFEIKQLQLKVKSLHSQLEESKPRARTSPSRNKSDVAAFKFQAGQASGGVLMKEGDVSDGAAAPALRPISEEEESVLAAFQDVYRNLTGEEISKKKVRGMAQAMSKAAKESGGDTGEIDTTEFLLNLEEETMAQSKEFLKLFEAARAGMDPNSFRKLQEISGE